MNSSFHHKSMVEFIGLLQLQPTLKQLTHFLSRNLDPLGKRAGIAWIVLNEMGLLDYQMVSGLELRLSPDERVSLADDNVVARAMRTQESIYFDMETMYHNYEDATHREGLSIYLSGIVLPISRETILGCVFQSPVEVLRNCEPYFESIRSLVALWENKLRDKTKLPQQVSTDQSRSLTERQNLILTRIQQGKTNAAIARELGFSDSLIRQETIIIYSKLGIAGRKDLRLDK